VIDSAATINYSLWCFAGCIPGAIWDLIQLAQWVSQPTSKTRKGARHISFKESHPRLFILYVVLNIVLVVALLLGFWLVFHPSIVKSSDTAQSGTNRALAAQNQTPEPTVNPKVTPKIPKNPAEKKVSPAATVTQNGNGSQQTVNQAPITQSNSGGCNQQVVGGNNNTNNCAPPPRNVDSNTLRDEVVAVAGISGSIWCDGSGNSCRVAKQIQTGLNAAGWSIGGDNVNVGDSEFYPSSLTIEISSDPNAQSQNAATTLRRALKKQNVAAEIQPNPAFPPNVMRIKVASQ
jgi:hypothetical protein